MKIVHSYISYIFYESLSQIKGYMHLSEYYSASECGDITPLPFDYIDIFYLLLPDFVCGLYFITR